ncbi:hypothetical protein JXC34_03150 [Candidatus Woesearchaeota archaeon]|nr:hypothetical protein [Candidatus Woesearchaeota archaeon]
MEAKASAAFARWDCFIPGQFQGSLDDLITANPDHTVRNLGNVARTTLYEVITTPGSDENGECELLVIYTALPLDFFMRDEDSLDNGKEKYSLVHPLEFQEGLFDSPVNLLDPEYSRTAQLFIVDYLNTMMLFTSDLMTVSFSAQTIGTGIEFYLGFMSAIGLFLPEWSPDVYVKTNHEILEKDPLIKKIHAREFGPKVSVYTDDEKMCKALISGHEEWEIDRETAKELYQNLIQELTAYAIAEGKLIIDGDNKYFDLSGGEPPEKINVEPYILFLYAHELFGESILEGSFRLPEYQERDDIYVYMPVSREQRREGRFDEPSEAFGLYARRFIPPENILSRPQYRQKLEEQHNL